MSQFLEFLRYLDSVQSNFVEIIHIPGDFAQLDDIATEGISLMCGKHTFNWNSFNI